MLLLSLITATLILISYDFFFNRNIKIKNSEDLFNKPVSVIICSKNEYENLKLNLPLILNQNYQKYEVVVVNDQSTDETAYLLKTLSKDYKNLRIVEIDKTVNYKQGKKFPLTLGIKSAVYDYLLLTDADCQPRSNLWIKKMSRNFCNNEIIIGFSPYKKEKTFLNKIIRFDTFFIAKQYLSFASTKNTYMAVGRNLGYKKNVFFNNNGFASHINLASGDDDLFIQEVASKHDLSIEVSLNSHMISNAHKQWIKWIIQKRRHITTSNHYKLKFKFLLFLYPFIIVFFWFSSFYLFYDQNRYIVLLILLFRFSFSYISNYKLMKTLDCIDLYIFHPLYEIITILIQGIFVLLNMVKRPVNWRK